MIKHEHVLYVLKKQFRVVPDLLGILNTGHLSIYLHFLPDLRSPRFTQRSIFIIRI